jgi:hypothetical protein
LGPAGVLPAGPNDERGTSTAAATAHVEVEARAAAAVGLGVVEELEREPPVLREGPAPYAVGQAGAAQPWWVDLDIAEQPNHIHRIVRR